MSKLTSTNPDISLKLETIRVITNEFLEKAMSGSIIHTATIEYDNGTVTLRDFAPGLCYTLEYHSSYNRFVGKYNMLRPAQLKPIDEIKFNGEFRIRTISTLGRFLGLKDKVLYNSDRIIEIRDRDLFDKVAYQFDKIHNVCIEQAKDQIKPSKYREINK